MLTASKKLFIKQFLLMVAVIVFVIGLSSGTSASAATSEPSVTITSPANSVILGPSGETVSIAADANDADGIAKVEFYVDGIKVGESTNAPYFYNWTSTVGLHNLSAKAYDINGNLGLSSKVTVQVPAKITLTNPANGKIISGVVNSFDATTSDPVYWYGLYIDGVYKTSNYLAGNTGTSITIPYSWDTTKLANGSEHVIEIMADTADGVTSLGKSTVKVDNDKPVVNIISPLNNSIVSDTVYINVDSTDQSGISKVEYFVDGVKIGENTNLPYTYSWESIVGTHIIMAKAYDNAGNVGLSSNLYINVPAKVQITNPQDGSNIGGIITEFKASFSSPVKGYVRLYIDGVHVKYVGSPFYTLTNVSIPFTWDTNQYDNGSSHLIEIRGYTESGSVLSVGKSTIIVDNTVDVTAPVVSITGPANGSTIGISGDDLELKADASDRVGVTKVEFYVDGAIVGESTNAPYSYIWKSTGGSHSITAKAYDEAGNVGTSSSITVSVPAKINITNPLDGSTVGGIITNFSADFSDPIKGSIRLYIDGVQVQYTGSPFYTKTDVNFAYAWDTNQYANGSSHVIEIRGYVNGVLSVGRSTIVVDNTVDVTAPVVSMTGPATGTKLNIAGETVELKADASDKVGVTKVEFYVDGVKVGEDASAPYSYEWVSTGGGHGITAKAYDEAGNVGTTSNSIYIEVPAKVEITSPVDGSTVGGLVSSFNANFSAQLRGVIRLYIDGVEVSRVGDPFTRVSNASFTYTWDTNQYTNGSSHVIEVKGYTDVGSVASTARINVIVDNTVDVTAPVVSMTGPATGTKLNIAGETVELKADASDKVGVTKVEFYVDGVKVGEDASAPYSYEWVSTGGRHDITAKAYDEVGNVGTSNSIYIEVPAKVEITSPVDGSTVGGLVSSFNANFSAQLRGVIRLYIDGVEVSRVGDPFTRVSNASFTYTWDTNQYTNGSSHVIEVKGYTDVGSVASAGSITVQVNN